MEKFLDVQAVILAAGKGTRMNSALPKVLVGLCGKSLIQHLLDNVKQVNFGHKPVVVVGHKYELVQSYLGSNFIYAFQEGQFGTAHALGAAKDKTTGKNILALYGDMPFIKAPTLLDFISRHEKSGSKFSMLTTTVPNFENEYQVFSGFGRILRDGHDQILKIQEFVDATNDERQVTEVNPGIYLFNSDWVWQNLDKVVKNKHGEYYLTDLVEIAIREGLQINSARIEPMEVYGVNTPAQLAQAEQLIS